MTPIGPTATTWKVPVPDLAYGTAAYSRARGEMPDLILRNMMVEATPVEKGGVVLLSRPGLVEDGPTHGNGPVRALLSQEGVLNGARVAVSDGTLWVDGDAIGPVTGAGPASIAGNEIGVVATAGASAVFYDGTDFSTIAFPDTANVRKVIEQGGRFLFLRDDTQAFYWTDVLADMLSGSGQIVVDALNYASAESEPDSLRDILPVEGGIALIGSATVERWTLTGDNDLPYVPVQGLVFKKGARDTGCAASFDNTFAWVSPEHIVYLAGNVPQRISDSGIEERIQASTTCRVDSFFWEGHELLKINLDSDCVLFDAQTRQWCEWASMGQDRFVGGPVIDGPVFGSLVNGRLVQFADSYSDLGGTLERTFRAGLPIDGGAFSIHNLRLRTRPGHTTELSGDYAEPVVEMRYSDDLGQTWSDWESAELGAQGDYRVRTEWRALGMHDDPGVLFEFRCTDPVNFVVAGVTVNERLGGRSR